MRNIEIILGKLNIFMQGKCVLQEDAVSPVNVKELTHFQQQWHC
jgi:hypothetical protein